MTTEYYIEQEDKIVLHDTDRERLQTTLTFMPQYAGLAIQETEKEIIQLDNEFVFKDDKLEELAEIERQKLVTKLYEIKAEKAYGGIIINDQLIFETNQISITNTVATLSLMPDQGTTNWKFYTVDGVPAIQPITKAQLYGLATFGQNMINQCFSVEGAYNVQLQQATVAQLNDEEWIDAFVESAQEAMDEVNNHMTATFSEPQVEE